MDKFSFRQQNVKETRTGTAPMARGARSRGLGALSNPYPIDALVRRWPQLHYVSDLRLWVAVCLAWAAIIAWSHRNEMDPDGFSYLQMASHAANGRPSALVNPYWSPAYPAMLTVLLAVFRPSGQAAFAFAHLLNYILFSAALCAFIWYLRSWSRVVPIPQRLLIPFGFILFLKFAIDWLGVHNCTPDLTVAIAVLLAAAVLSKVMAGGAPNIYLPVLGLILAFGYYAKAAMFPLSLFLLAFLFLFPPSSDNLSRFAIWKAAAVFGLASAPLLFLQSRRVGHATFGEVGRLAYVWFVNDGPTVQGEKPADPRFHRDHPPRTICDKPLTLEFGSPVDAIYPLWYDPFYWSKGLQPSFHLNQQISTIKVTARTYGAMAMDIFILIVGACFLLWREHAVSWLFKRSNLWSLLWPLSCVALYGLVHTETRFLGGFMIVFWTAILSAALKSSRIDRRVAVALIGVILLLPTSARLALAMSRSASDLLRPTPTSELLTARALRSDGLRSGDAIAVVGPTFEPYYAWFADLKVIAQVPVADQLWTSTPAEIQSWLLVLRQRGVKAVVARDRPFNANQISWQDIPATGKSNSTIIRSARYSIHLLGPE